MMLCTSYRYLSFYFIEASDNVRCASVMLTAPSKYIFCMTITYIGNTYKPEQIHGYFCAIQNFMYMYANYTRITIYSVHSVLDGH